MLDGHRGGDAVGGPNCRVVWPCRVWALVGTRQGWVYAYVRDPLANGLPW